MASLEVIIHAPGSMAVCGHRTWTAPARLTVLLILCLIGMTACDRRRESWNSPQQVTAYLDWQQYKQYTHADPERISCSRYGAGIALAVAWDSALFGLAVLSSKNGGGCDNLPIVLVPVTTEITISFRNASGQILDQHRVRRGSNIWTESFDDDMVDLYVDISSPRLVRRNVFLRHLSIHQGDNRLRVDVADELQLSRRLIHQPDAAHHG